MSVSSGKPTRADLPADIGGMSRNERDELAAAYLDLFGNLLDALHECNHGYAFVSFSDRGTILSTGHLPHDLYEHIRKAEQR